MNKDARIDQETSCVRMILIVEDPDPVFTRAIRAGATAVAPIGEGHGWRVERVADPSGHHWEMGKPLTSLEPHRLLASRMGRTPCSDTSPTRADGPFVGPDSHVFRTSRALAERQIFGLAT